MRKRISPDYTGCRQTILHGPRLLEGYTVRVLPGRLRECGVDVDDALDNIGMTYTQAGRLHRDAAVEYAFAAGICAGLRLAQEREAR